MSQQVTENMVQQFGSNFKILGQQRTARFMPWVQNEGHITGTAKSVERLGKSEAYDLQSRHSDTQYVQTPHSRRWLDLTDKAWAELVDEMDKIKMLADPTSQYLQLGVAALNRAKDDVIYAAARGNARVGTGASAGVIALPAAQKIAEGGTGLTLAKLMTAKEILDAAEIEPMLDADGQGPTADRVIVVSSRQITNLLNTTEIKSVDYNNVKALSQGAIDTFLGFKFVRSERLAKSGTSRFVTAWVRGSVAYGTGMEIVHNIDPLPGKNYSVQVYARESVGAVRTEDEGVVEIACFE